MPSWSLFRHQALAFSLLSAASLPAIAGQTIDLTQAANTEKFATISTPLFSSEAPGGRLQPGQVVSTQVNGKQFNMEVAADSQPDKGMYRLQTLASDTGRSFNLGYVHYQQDRIVSVLSLPGQQPVRIVEKDGQTRITAIPERISEPFKVPGLDDNTEDNAFDLPHLSVKPKGQPDSSVMLSPEPPDFPPFENDGTVSTLILIDPRVPGEAGLRAEIGFSSKFDATIEQVDAQTDSIFQRSGLAYTHNIAGVHTIELDTVNTSFPKMDSGNILDELVSNGKMGRLLDRYNADTVHFIGINDGKVCGQAWTASSINSDNQVTSIAPDYYTAYSNFRCLDNSTYAHELGHNLGLAHDRKTLTNDSQGGGTALDFHIPYGYIPENNQFYTTMAYSRSCDRDESDDGGTCYDENIYSNPAVFIGDTPAGKDAAEVDAADASSAASITLPSASLMRFRHDYYPVKAQVNNGVIELDPQIFRVDTIRVAGSNCSTNSYINPQSLADAQELGTQQVLTIPLEDWDIPLCFYGENTDELGFTGYALLAEYQANVSAEDYLLVAENAVKMTRTGNNAEITLLVADNTMSNEDIGLALRYDPELQRPATDTATAEAEEWFDYSVYGIGYERTLSLTLKTSLDKIASQMGADDLRNAYHLPLTVFDKRYGPQTVSSVVWIEESAYLAPPASGYFTLGKSIDAGSDFELEAILHHVPFGVTPVLEQTSELKVNNFSYQLQEEDSGNSTGGYTYSVQLTGEVPDLASNQRWEVTARFDHEDTPDVTLPLMAISTEGKPYFTELEVINPVSGSGNEVKVKVATQDNDSNLDLSTFKLDLFYPGGEVQTFTTSYSDWSDLSTTINLGELETGEYQAELSVSDVDGNTAKEILPFDVVENLPVKIEEIIEPDGVLRVGEAFSLGFTLVEGRNPVDTISWSADGPGNVQFSTTTEKTTEITVDAPGEYTIKPWVEDVYGSGVGFAYKAEVTDNQPPTVEIEASSLSVEVGTSVTLKAIADDPDETLSEFSWQQISGTSLSVTGGTSDTLTIDTDKTGSFRFRVTVSDSEGETASDEVSFRVIAADSEGSGSSDNSSSGGSVGYLLLMLLALAGLRKRIM
ncbi:MAG: PKD domain-containing protein [Pseudomonadota bacterium]